MKQIQNKFLKVVVIVGLLAFLPVSAKAACTNPAGTEGQQMYNTTYKVMQFCDGTNWVSMKGGTATTLDALSCADGEVAKWNNAGSAWECATDNSGGAETDPQVGTLTSGKWCTTDGTDIDCTSNAPSGGFTSCTTKTSGGSGVSRTINCNSGTTMTGGGCRITNTLGQGTIAHSYPNGNGWTCYRQSGNWTYAYVRCCS
ncbi:MAG: hypothetical protein MRY79_00280 [Alphaproteobacteria bacterium]|nr:hypothetical protein [Alphaproteobacteria bacterium]